MTIKIDNYEGAADLLTFPHNPRVFDNQIDPFVDKKQFPYAFSYVGVTDQLKAQQSIVITGFTSGTNRLSDYRNIAKQLTEPKIKKFYFASDKFYIGIGAGCKRTHSGGRTNFVDYVGQFYSPFGILFGDTQNSVLYNDNTDANDGNVFTPIEQITGSVTNGQTVTITDSDGNGFTFVASGTGTFTYKLVTLQDLGGGNKFLAFATGSIGSTLQKLKVASNDKSIILGLEPGETMNDISITQTNITGTYKFRDGYTGD